MLFWTTIFTTAKEAIVTASRVTNSEGVQLIKELFFAPGKELIRLCSKIEARA
jgi:hypothetical protein